MGDHGAVDMCQDAHRNLLMEGGLLSREHELHALRPCPLADCWETVVIDDLCIVQKLPAVAPHDGVRQDVQQINRAKEIYEREAMRGSAGKEVIGEARTTILGAEFCSEDADVARGHFFLGVLVSRRMSLCHFTLRMSVPLMHSLVGAWTSVMGYRCPLMVLFQEVYQFVLLPKNELHCVRANVRDNLLLACALGAAAEVDLTAPVSDHIAALDASPDYGAVCEL